MDWIDIDLFNKEQRPCNYDYDCLEFGERLQEIQAIDLSDELYEEYREKKREKREEEKAD